MKDLSESVAKKFDVNEGIYVQEVKRFSKAANQALSKGLVIVEADKEIVNSVEEFEEIIDSKKGSAVLLKVKYPNGDTRFVGLEIPE